MKFSEVPPLMSLKLIGLLVSSVSGAPLVLSRKPPTKIIVPVLRA